MGMTVLGSFQTVLIIDARVSSFVPFENIFALEGLVARPTDAQLETKCGAMEAAGELAPGLGYTKSLSWFLDSTECSGGHPIFSYLDNWWSLNISQQIQTPNIFLGMLHGMLIEHDWTIQSNPLEDPKICHPSQASAPSRCRGFALGASLAVVCCYWNPGYPPVMTNIAIENGYL